MLYAMACALLRGLSLFLLVCTLVPPSAFASTDDCPAAISSGQPACAESQDIGSHSPNPKKSRHVGNPVDIVSGNKYQSEVDVRLGVSRLSLVRHYNSVNSTANLGLGNGWRHTYSVLLVTDGNDIRRITQSDGRVIEFRKNGARHQSLNEDDGYILIQPNNKHAWHLPDGRVLSFHGSFLTKIADSDGAALTLFYQHRRLHTVTDEFGNSIVFRYAPGRIGLRAYEPSTDQTPSGHLIAIGLPDGSDVQYRYDNLQNLISVKYPRADQSNAGYHYRYSDENNSTLLTERSNWRDKVLARWSYDTTERVISYRKGMHVRPDGSESGAPNISLSYSAGDVHNSGTTVATYRNGSQTKFHWLLDENRQVVELSEKHTEPAELQAKITQPGKTSPIADGKQLAPPHLSDVLTILAVDELGYPSKVRYRVSGETAPHGLDVSYSQSGELLRVDWQTGVIKDINPNQRITRKEYSDFVNAHWAAGTRMPEVLSALTQRKFIEIDTKTFLTDSNKPLGLDAIITGEDLATPWSSSLTGDALKQFDATTRAAWDPPGTTSCLADTLRDCEELLRARDYAELADCAYVESLCDTRFFEANLDQLGIDLSDIVYRSFRAGIFYDRENNEYIVTFSGTNFTSPRDWINNAQQEFGNQAFQYEYAVQLARQLTQLNPDLSFRFTGHSLGGGLAAAAAASTGLEAIVFNPAALSPETANNYAFDIENAEYNTDVFSVDGELLSNVQNDLGFTNEVRGTIHTLPRPQFSWIQANVGQNPLTAYGTRLSFALHGMDAVRQSLDDLIERYHCV